MKKRDTDLSIEDKEGASELQGAADELTIGQLIKESAGQIWLAGLGAYVKAEKEGGKLFEALVKDGKKVEAHSKREEQKEEKREEQEHGLRIDQHIAAYRGLVEERVEGVKDRATSSWEKLERAFDERVSRALGRLNIPTKADVESLTERIDVLSAAIEKIAHAQLTADEHRHHAASPEEAQSRPDQKD